MADKASAYLGGLAAGEHIADIGVEAYTRALQRQDVQSEREKERAAREQALKTEADRYKDTQAEKQKHDLVEKERADTSERHAKKQDQLIDAEIESMKRGNGLHGLSGKQPSDPVGGVLWKSLSNARASRTGLSSNPSASQSDVDKANEDYNVAQAEWDRYAEAKIHGTAYTPTPKSQIASGDPNDFRTYLK